MRQIHMMPTESENKDKLIIIFTMCYIPFPYTTSARAITIGNANPETTEPVVKKIHPSRKLLCPLLFHIKMGRGVKM